MHGEKRNAYNILVRNPEGKRPLGRSRHSWEDNIKTDLKEIWCNNADRSDLVQDSDPWWAL
jgi:hypothetical protein